MDKNMLSGDYMALNPVTSGEKEKEKDAIIDEKMTEIKKLIMKQ